VDQRRGEASAAATKGVTDRNRAAVDVQFFVRDAELALAGEGLRSERLVLRNVGPHTRNESTDICLPCRQLISDPINITLHVSRLATCF